MHISVSGREWFNGQGRLGTAFLVALSLHVGALTALMFWSSRNLQDPPGEQEITIDLAPAMEFAEAVTPHEASTPAELLAEATEVQPQDPVTAEDPPPEEATEVVEMTKALPPQATDVMPSQETAEAKPADAAPVEAVEADEPAVVAAVPPSQGTAIAKAREEKPAPRALRKLPFLKKAEHKPPPRREVAEQQAAPSTSRQGQPSSSRENTGGAAASADPNALDRYAAQLAAALRGRLRYPEPARAQGMSGVAMIRFTMQRSGQIVNASIVHSTGHQILDYAALTAAAPGTSLPPAPEAIQQKQLIFVVPLRFSLR
jgi:protein TonB